MKLGNRRRAVLGTLAAAAVAASVLVPAGAAVAADYPPEVSPAVTNRDANDAPASVQGATAVKGATATNNSASGSLALTGGDIEGLAAIGAGAAIVGAVMVRRGRARRV